MTSALSRPESRLRRPNTQQDRLDLESFAAAAGLHPDFVLRLVALGLIEASPGPATGPHPGPAKGSSEGTDGELWFSPAQLAAVARIQRLRSGLSLNYAALGLVLDLLDRVAELEAALRRRPGAAAGPTARSSVRPRGGRPWTRTA